jgi:hypothetical protein
MALFRPPLVSPTSLDMNPSSDVTLDVADSNQHLRDLKLAIEFKYLMKHAPGGVYLLPEFEVCHISYLMTY